MKKTISVLLAALLLFSCFGAWAHPFTDVAGNWAEAEIAAAYENGIVSGDGDGRFRPEDTISRAEFMKMVTVLLVERFSLEFPETEASAHWADPYYEFATSAYLPVYPEVSYDGVSPAVMSAADYDLPIRRWEMAYILDMAVYAGYGVRLEDEVGLTDMAAIEANYDESISAAVRNIAGLGLAKGDDNGNYNPVNTGTRAEAVALVNRLATLMTEVEAYLTAQEEEENMQYQEYEAQLEAGMATYTDIPEGNPVVEFTMADGGVFEITLYPEYAPQSCANFVKLVEDKFYDGLTFHRVVDGFVAQGGDPKGDGTGGSEGNIFGEFASNGFAQNTLRHERGVVSMARSQHPNSASSQFFICYDDVSYLDGNYAAFGKVTRGMEVVDSFLEVERTSDASGAASVPTTPITIQKAVMK